MKPPSKILISHFFWSDQFFPLVILQAVSDAKGGTVYRDHLPHLGENGGGGGLLGATAGATSGTQAPVAIGLSLITIPETTYPMLL